ncbi:MAG: response regulator [FCB group bacterium]|nr:response regulator [FCB group bacterium]
MADKSKTSEASILVVDDEQIVLNLVEDTLTDDGYDVTITISAKEAIELVKQHHFDFILTDIRMPEMNGIELVKEIHEIVPTLGVIFMTGYANLDTAKQAIKEGAYDYIMKPFELSEIRQAISRAVAQRQSATEATLSQELNKIADLSSMMYASGDLASLMQLSLSFAIIQSKAKAGVAVYFNSRQEELIVMQADGRSGGAEEVCRFGVPASDWKMIPTPTAACLLENEVNHPLFGLSQFQAHKDKILPGESDQSKAVVIVPLVRADTMLGIISLFHENSEYQLKSSDTRFLGFISNQLAISLENLQLLEDSREAYSRLEELQDQTIQMEKMATQGQMSAEIGHELNNYLGVVVANFQLMNLRIRKGATEGLERFTESIEDHLDKISRFTKGLMDNSSMKKATFAKTDMNTLLTRIIEFLRPQKRFRDFDFDIKLNNDLPQIEIDQGFIEQVLYNLFNNAADASIDSPIKKIDIGSSVTADGLVRISIKDYGSGISEEKLPKLFKEKFTTKETGHGIGLVVCRNIVQRHNGKISVQSVSGQGTAFFIDLPENQDITEKTAAGVI